MTVLRSDYNFTQYNSLPTTGSGYINLIRGGNYIFSLASEKICAYNKWNGTSLSVLATLTTTGNYTFTQIAYVNSLLLVWTYDTTDYIATRVIKGYSFNGSSFSLEFTDTWMNGEAKTHGDYLINLYGTTLSGYSVTTSGLTLEDTETTDSSVTSPSGRDVLAADGSHIIVASYEETTNTHLKKFYIFTFNGASFSNVNNKTISWTISLGTHNNFLHLEVANNYVFAILEAEDDTSADGHRGEAQAFEISGSTITYKDNFTSASLNRFPDAWSYSNQYTYDWAWTALNSDASELLIGAAYSFLLGFENNNFSLLGEFQDLDRIIDEEANNFQEMANVKLSHDSIFYGQYYKYDATTFGNVTNYGISKFSITNITPTPTTDSVTASVQTVNIGAGTGTSFSTTVNTSEFSAQTSTIGLGTKFGASTFGSTATTQAPTIPDNTIFNISTTLSSSTLDVAIVLNKNIFAADAININLNVQNIGVVSTDPPKLASINQKVKALDVIVNVS